MFKYYLQPKHLELGTQIWFTSQDEYGIIIKTGKIVGFIDEDHDCYRVLSNDEEFELKDKQVYTSESDVMHANNIQLFELEGFINRIASIGDTIFAPNLESAKEIFKKKYPEVISIREADHWR